MNTKSFSKIDAHARLRIANDTSIAVSSAIHNIKLTKTKSLASCISKLIVIFPLDPSVLISSPPRLTQKELFSFLKSADIFNVLIGLMLF